MKHIKVPQIVTVLGVLAISTGGALAALTVGNSALPSPTGGDFGVTKIFTTTSEDPIAPVMDVDNTADSQRVKYLWMEVTMSSASVFFQLAGEDFDPSLWPSITAGGSAVTITGVAYSDVYDGGFKSYLTATIVPQPASETITMPTWSTEDFAKITSVKVVTACYVPEPASLSIMGMMLLVAAGYRRRDR